MAGLAWVTGTVSMPEGLARTIQEKLKNKPAMNSDGQRYKKGVPAFIAVHHRSSLAKHSVLADIGFQPPRPKSILGIGGSSIQQDPYQATILIELFRNSIPS